MNAGSIPAATYLLPSASGRSTRTGPSAAVLGAEDRSTADRSTADRPEARRRTVGHSSSVRGALLALIAATLPSCIPSTAGYLVVPLVTEDGTGAEAATVELRFAHVRERLPEFDLARFAVFAEGRTPLHHALVDTDRDGAVDALRFVVDVAAGDEGTEVILVSPGAATMAEGPAPGTPTGSVIPRWDRAHR